MSSASTKVVGRLAPSPTGAQHVGNARTYLLAWLSARRRGGQVRLRIEDIDSPRIKAGAAAEACTDLTWLGLDWDGDIVVQSQRLSLYEAGLAQLREHELIYPCTCSRADVERAASAPHAEHEGAVYPGTCAHRSARDATQLGNRPYCWRFRVPDKVVTFTDRYCGTMALGRRDIGGDFVVWRMPEGTGVGLPAYQLAVVIDDAALGITEVVRGDDLLTSTPRQLLLYEALGLAAPVFAHVPLVVGPDGRRLAKRHGDTRLSALRAAGVKPSQLIGLLAWSCGWLPRIEPVSARMLLQMDLLELLPHEPFVLDASCLRAIGYG